MYAVIPFSQRYVTLASSDAKTWTLHKSTINVDTLLITLYETYEPVCMKQNLELKLHLSEESYPAMLTDKDRLFQILCVFMDNAIQHSKNNSLIEIEVIATEKNIAFLWQTTDKAFLMKISSIFLTAFIVATSPIRTNQILDWD